jgi:hypothetical protein
LECRDSSFDINTHVAGAMFGIGDSAVDVCFGSEDGYGGRASVTGCHSDSVGFGLLGTDVARKVGVGYDSPFWYLGLFDKENGSGAFDSFVWWAIATDSVR